MRDEEQKRLRFKQLQARNYRASLQLEGFEIGLPDQQQADAKALDENEKIQRLRKEYAR
ncbi:YhfG family protein [Photobacterium sanguinicancri]|uniref:DUF2559 domain-containing protein n=1 Tax=Photobacterium sanguinicancri TaxID=875932 RepID=A0ABX4FT17_9GAMM|nr:YhfG family protein [Photobacterium sanguinicancri]OZS42009.1 DUF2559 domain-containing protein [Photobacterium sanguinicancri]